MGLMVAEREEAKAQRPKYHRRTKLGDDLHSNKRFKQVADITEVSPSEASGQILAHLSLCSVGEGHMTLPSMNPEAPKIKQGNP